VLRLHGVLGAEAPAGCALERSGDTAATATPDGEGDSATRTLTVLIPVSDLI
jgi:hypothetical protein